MATEDVTVQQTETESTAGDDGPDGRLFDWYRTYIGEPESERDVYLGFGLFTVGMLMAAAALILFLWGSTLDWRSETQFGIVQPAYALGMVALPTLMLGILVLLPTDWRLLAASGLGSVLTIGATIGFLYAYPAHWNFYGDPDYTVEVTVTYALGMVAITGSTGAALIGHYLEMARTVERVERVVEAEEEEEHYSDEEIRADIESAMDQVDLSWGGVRKTDHKRLEFTADEFDASEVGQMGVTKSRGSSVEDQVAGLKGLRYGTEKTATSDRTVDDQTAKLKELRAKQQAKGEAVADPGGIATANGSGFVASFKSRIRSVRNRVKRN